MICCFYAVSQKTQRFDCDRSTKTVSLFVLCCFAYPIEINALVVSRYEDLLQEKEELEEAFETFKQDDLLTKESTSGKEIRILKKVVKNLEVCCMSISYEECLPVCTNLILHFGNTLGGNIKGTFKASEICQQKERRNEIVTTRGERA